MTSHQVERRERIRQQLLQQQLEYQRWLATIPPDRRQQAIEERRRRLGFGQRGLGRLFQEGAGASGYGSAPTSRGKVIVAPRGKKRRK
jgi:hypothetical protein